MRVWVWVGGWMCVYGWIRVCVCVCVCVRVHVCVCVHVFCGSFYQKMVPDLSLCAILDLARSSF